MAKIIKQEYFFNETFGIIQLEDMLVLEDYELQNDYKWYLGENPTETDIKLAWGRAFEIIVRQAQSGQYRNLIAPDGYLGKACLKEDKDGEI